MNKSVIGRILLLILAFGVLVSTGGFAQTKSELTARIDRAKEYLDDIMKAPDTAIPESLMKNAEGIIILRQYKAGFVLGVKGGVGIVLVKDESGKWSSPAFIKTGEGSFGPQIGAESVDSIFLIMNEEGMSMLNKTKFKIGVDASATVGPVGRDAEAKVGAGTAILAYSRAKGLYAGAAFEGGLLLSDDSANAKFYNMKGITLKNILFEGKVKMPSEAKPLVDSINSYAGMSGKTMSK